jgi:signal transduction histidine kinase/CHASE3 domain sensor protein
MLSRLTIGRAVLVANVALATVIALEFVLLVVAIGAQRSSARDARDTEAVLATANKLEKTVLDLETGERGYVIARREEFLDPWRAARRDYPRLAAELEGEVADEPTQLARARSISRAIRRYERSWATPLVTAARTDAPRARALVRSGQGKEQVDRIRAEFAVFTAAQSELFAQERRRANRLGWIAIGIGVGGLVATLGLIALLATFAYRLVAAPIERLAVVARTVAAGDLHARAVDEGAREIAQLGADFNAMTESLQEREGELRAVLDSTETGLLMADTDGRIRFSNAAMDSIWSDLGVASAGGIWERVAGLAERIERADEYAVVFAQLADDPELTFESQFTVPDLRRAFVGRTAPVHDADGNLIGRIFSLREVTREREAERLKDEFVATVSHELRTPLTSIRGFVELLQAGEGGTLSADQRRFLAVVDRNSERLLHLVGDLLLIAELDAQTLRLDLEQLDLAEVAVDAVESARPSAEEAGLQLELFIDDAPSVRGDHARLSQLADNLVSNAIKFTPSGGLVEVSAGSRDGRATLAVRDNGPGMSPEELEQLFQRFYRTSRAAAQQVPGTGLGLAISRAIAEAHGGTITVASREGQGTTFTLELPLG